MKDILEKVFLNSGWKFIDFKPDEGDPNTLSRIDIDMSPWHDITIPGDINAALVRDGNMPNPHFGDNARKCYWVTAKEWWFRLEFYCKSGESADFTDLCLDGIDGHVDLYLNGKKLGRMENAFRLHRFDVCKLIKTDKPNILLLRFQSIDEILGSVRIDELAGWRQLRVLMRKPQFSFGWDWALPLPSIGIMGNVWLEHYAGPRLTDVSIQTHLSGRIDFKFRVNVAARDARYYLLVKVKGYDIDIKKKVERLQRCFSHTSLYIENPVLWWPNGMGKPALYDYSVELIVHNQVVESRNGRFGIREVSIEETPFTPDAGPGISFWLKINNQRVFCKGGNWIPLELWPAEAKDEQYRFYLKKAADANFNMLRVWGGGIYERDIFYDICDELGIMVWQDFMFASTGYPVDHLRKEIISEADYQIKRLRIHPSIVLWCGCNEDVYSWTLPDENDKVDAMADTGVYSQSNGILKVNRLRDDPQIYSMILRGLVNKLGLCVPYIESSPGSYEDAGNCPESGNSHLSCWKYVLFVCRDHPEQFRKHFDQTISFNSEFCVQGPCNEQTLKEFLPAEHHWPPDEMWIYHIQRGHNNYPHYQQTLWIAEALFGKINSLQEYVKYGQATHAEIMRAEFESARRDRPNNGGTMIWMFNDCWPTSNWSIIDYYRRTKPCYYSAKRTCATFLPIIFERKGKVEFFFSNDSNRHCKTNLQFGQAHLDGTVVWMQEKTVLTNPVDTVQFHSVDKKKLKLKVGDYLFIDAIIDKTVLPQVTYFPDGWNNIPWAIPKPRLELLSQTQDKNRWITTIKIKTDTYARFCHLLLPEENATYWLSDNFFDISVGREHTVTVYSDKPFSIKNVQVGNWHTKWS